MAFKKGQGGRPKGIPNKATADVRAQALPYTAEALAVLVTVMRDEKHPQRVAAANAVLDRGHGKPAQALTASDGGPLIPATIIHEHLTG